MKKLFLVCLLGFSSCFAINLKVTKIIKDHNLYVLEHKYVIQSSSAMVDVVVGSKLHFDENLFYGSDQWIQNHDVTTSRYVDTVYTDHYDIYGYYTHTSSYDNYSYDTVTYQYTFYPIGITNRRSMKLPEFTAFAANRAFQQPLYSYSTIFTGHEWLGDDKDIKTSYFPTSSVPGEEETLDWLVNELQMYEDGYKHKIYPIFDRNYPDLLAGVLHLSKKRKVFLFDHIDGLAIFQRQ